MTANELLSLLGRAWSRLLIYPGGLAAFGVVALLVTLQNRKPASWRAGVPSTASQVIEQLRSSRLLVLGSIVLPWLALALLPLPLAVALPRQIDIVVALALLEWPNLLAIRQDLRAGELRRLAAALNSYPPLILATLVLSQASNSLEIVGMARPPDPQGALITSVLHWLGAIALALALPPALGIGPFAGEPTTNDQPQARKHFSNPLSSIQIGLWLRALGLVALAALPWAGAEGTAVALLRLLCAAALIAALLWGFDRLTRGQAARRWAWAYLALDAALLLALLVAAYAALQSRLA